jgi:4-aminobutyrate aminotransferase-like enzyme
VAAIIIEPFQGEGRIRAGASRFLQRIRELCDQHGIVMIADEVQCGFARTGKLFALEHYGLAADIVVTAKSLGAGMPISAITGRADIMDAHMSADGRHLRRQPADLRRRDRRDRDDAPARLPRARRADRRDAARDAGWMEDGVIR